MLKVLENPLNYYIIPESNNKRLLEYDSEERVILSYSDNSKKKLKQFINNLKSI